MMGEKAKKFTMIAAYDAAHASVASMGIRPMCFGYNDLVQVIAEAVFGGSPEAAIEKYAKQCGRTPYAVWREIRDCLQAGHVKDGVLDTVRKAVQMALSDGQPDWELEEEPEQDIEQLREELRQIMAEDRARRAQRRKVEKGVQLE